MAKVMISMPEDLLAVLDEAAKDASKTRSELIRDAIRLYMASGKPTPDRAAIFKRMQERNRGFVPPAPPEQLVREDRDSHW